MMAALSGMESMVNQLRSSWSRHVVGEQAKTRVNFIFFPRLRRQNLALGRRDCSAKSRRLPDVSG